MIAETLRPARDARTRAQIGDRSRRAEHVGSKPQAGALVSTIPKYQQYVSVDEQERARAAERRSVTKRAVTRYSARTCCWLIPSVPSGLLAIPIRYCDTMRVIESSKGS